MQIAAALILLVQVNGIAAARAPFSALLRSSDIVAVGTAVSSIPVREDGISFDYSPVKPSQLGPPYACEFSIRIGARIKDDTKRPASGVTESFLWFLPFRDCGQSSPWLSDLQRTPAIWLLRSERGRLRALEDNDLAYRLLSGFSPDVQARLKDFSAPRLAVAYLFIKPDALVSRRSYIDHRSPDFGGLVSFTEEIRLYREVFMESDAGLQGRIAVVLAEKGFCLNMAKRTLADQRLDLKWPIWLLDPNNAERQDYADAAQINFAAKADAIAHYGGEGQAIDELTFFGCESLPRTRKRARELLLRFFNVEADTLPCVPCE